LTFVNGNDGTFFVTEIPDLELFFFLIVECDGYLGGDMFTPGNLDLTVGLVGELLTETIDTFLCFDIVEDYDAIITC
jgi:hypothetical protein